MGNRRFEHDTNPKRKRGSDLTPWLTLRVSATLAVMAFGLAMLAGCATTTWPWNSHTAAETKSSASEAKTASSPPKTSGSQTDAEALQQVMSELQQVGAIDPAARDELMADLKKSDPSFWPMELQAFQAAAAYRRREAEREAERQKQESTTLDGPREDPRVRTAAGSEKANLPSGSRAGGEGSFPAKPAPTSQIEPISPSSNSLREGAANLDDRPALLPEPPPKGGLDASSTAATTGTGKSAQSSPTAPDPPSIADRLAATRGEASASVVPTAGIAVALPGGTPLSEADWQAHLTEAIRSIESESKAGSKNESDIALQARLRMLYLLAGRRDDAMRPLPAAPQASQNYWSRQIYGLSTWMDAEKTPDAGRRAAETKRILGEALAQLGETAPLAVRNLTFCTEVLRFGSFEAVKSTDFTPGQKVLLYAEVDNLHIESSAKGYHWAVKISGQIFDSRGTRMEDYGSTTAEEISQTPRHDFFVSKLYFLPRLVPGHYTLQLTIEDTLGHKVGQSSIDFTVKPQ